jgi:hypothetical protein
MFKFFQSRAFRTVKAVVLLQFLALQSQQLRNNELWGTQSSDSIQSLGALSRPAGVKTVGKDNCWQWCVERDVQLPDSIGGNGLFPSQNTHLQFSRLVLQLS